MELTTHNIEILNLISSPPRSPSDKDTISPLLRRDLGEFVVLDCSNTHDYIINTGFILLKILIASKVMISPSEVDVITDVVFSGFFH